MKIDGLPRMLAISLAHYGERLAAGQETGLVRGLS
jgi:hypothetical protein